MYRCMCIYTLHMSYDYRSLSLRSTVRWWGLVENPRLASAGALQL